MSIENIQELRKSYGQFPTGVTVITCKDELGNSVGVTASSFNTVSLDPPLVLWSVDKGALSAAVFQTVEHFAVNILAEQQVSLSNKFAGRGTDKFQDVAYQLGLGDSPLIDGAIAQFECKTWNVYEGGDHLIIVGEIIQQSADFSGSPLVFSQGKYAVTSAHPEMLERESHAFTGTNFLSEYLPYLLKTSSNLYSEKLYPYLQSKFDISLDQWRIIIALTDKEQTSVDDISNLVMQPEDTLKRDLYSLLELDLIEHQDSNFILSEQGNALSEQLKTAMVEFEQNLLKKLDAEEATELKRLLNKLISTIRD
jgi:flavin reductase (DIM6/NTAB) family NADH-FMN oxidoreductase RutF/DNA-binding MarR family transcriptional regulator